LPLRFGANSFSKGKIEKKKNSKIIVPKKKVDNQIPNLLVILYYPHHYLLQCDIAPCVFILYSKNFGMLEIGSQNLFFLSF
jgi:hypothetical protein